MIVHIYWQWQF